jgi:gentisate 1,2-dioxygenase
MEQVMSKTTLVQDHIFRDGEIVPFGQYLGRTRRKREAPIAWSADEIRAAVAAMPHGERGTLALVNPEAPEAGTIARGLSLAVQVVRKGESTSPHAHSFWHLYLVQSGAGLADFGDVKKSRPIAAGDVLMFPAWCAHAFHNHDGKEDLVLICLQNLPECANMGSLVRQEATGELAVVYAEHSAVR